MEKVKKIINSISWVIVALILEWEYPMAVKISCLCSFVLSL